MQDIGYSGQYYHNHPFQIKVRTGSDIKKGLNDALAGEILYDTSVNGICIAKSCTTETNHGVCGLFDIYEDHKIPYNAGSLEFNGTSYITAPALSSLDLSGDCSFSFFIKPSSGGSDSGTFIRTMDYRSSGSTNTFYMWFGETNGSVNIVGFDGDTETWRDNGIYNLEFDAWNHIVVSFDSSSSTLNHFLNGSYIKSTNTAGKTLGNLSSGFHLGALANGGTTPTVQWYNGLMADFTLFTRSVTPTEVGHLHGNGLSNPNKLMAEMNPDIYYKLDYNATDYSGSGLPGGTTNTNHVADYPGIIN